MCCSYQRKRSREAFVVPMDKERAEEESMGTTAIAIPLGLGRGGGADQSNLHITVSCEDGLMKQDMFVCVCGCE